MAGTDGGNIYSKADSKSIQKIQGKNSLKLKFNTMTDVQKLANKVEVSAEVTPGPGSLSITQLGRGLLYAVISAVLPLVYSAFDTALTGAVLVIPWHLMEITAGATALSYLGSKLVGPTQQIITFKKPKV